MNNTNKEKISQLVETFCSCSIDEIRLFISLLSQRYNIDFASLSSVTQSSAPEETKQEQKKSLYLVGVKESKKASVIKALTTVLTLKITEANDKVKTLETSPILIKADVSESDIQDIRKTLEDAGSILELR